MRCRRVGRTTAAAARAHALTRTAAGEIHELKLELQNEKREKKSEAVKKVIAAMTVGKDVSSLFPDVLNCMQTDNLELKKLVYLYIMNYAKSQPDVAIMAVNTFVNDCKNENALIRALAVRTMGCIRVREITEYLLEPLRACLKDKDPYVRKTAAVCVAKLYDIDPEQTENGGFIDELRELLSDANPMVVANAVAALAEISESSEKAQSFFQIDTSSLNKLLTALNECTEWGQIFILDSLALYTPVDEKEAVSICDRITSRLSHANAAVVLSAVRVLMKFMEMITDVNFIKAMTKKLAPPLVTLLSNEAEVQYVALRNISLIVQKRPEVLRNEMKVFFVKYNDPIYVKLEKLDIMIRLASEQNIAQVLAELKEYAAEVDVDFVRKSVRAIGRCAIKIESAAEKCVNTLLELIQTKVNYVVQEAIVVIKDIFRKYPNKYESIIATLCENLDTLDELEAKASMIWIIGEYAERIDNAAELLGSFLDSFLDENVQVQLQLLTAIVKLFLKAPSSGQALVQKVLQLATHDSDNPDLRDRAYIYWRLLSADPATAKRIVLGEKPRISDETDMLEPSLLDELISHIGTLASVYHKPPSLFVEGKTRASRHAPPAALARQQQDELADVDAEGPTLDGGAAADMLGSANVAGAPSGNRAGATGLEDLLGDVSLSKPAAAAAPAPGPAQTAKPAVAVAAELDFLGGSAPSAPPTMAAGVQSTNSAAAGLEDLFGAPVAPRAAGPTALPPQTWMPATRGKGLEISGTFVRREGRITMDMTFANRALQPMSGFAIMFNKNSFGLAPAVALPAPAMLGPNQTASISLPLVTNGPVQRMEPLMQLQVAIKNNIDVHYFSCNVPLHVLFGEDGNLQAAQFLEIWRSIPDVPGERLTVRGSRRTMAYDAGDGGMGVRRVKAAHRHACRAAAATERQNR